MAIILSVKERGSVGKKTELLRTKGILPGVLYGPEVESKPIEVDLNSFKKVYQEAGESSLIALKVGDKEYLVLIHEIQKNPISGEFIHVDFYQPILTEEVEVTVPVVFEGEAPAVRELGGTLIKEIQEIEVKALPQNLPHEIRISVEGLKTFEDELFVKDLKVAGDVKILREQDDIIAKVAPPEKEEEIKKPSEEEAEGVEKIEEREEEKEEEK